MKASVGLEKHGVGVFFFLIFFVFHDSDSEGFDNYICVVQPSLGRFFFPHVLQFIGIIYYLLFMQK